MPEGVAATGGNPPAAGLPSAAEPIPVRDVRDAVAWLRHAARTPGNGAVSNA